MRRQVIYNPQRDYYAVLGIDAHSTPDLIRRAYRQAVRDAHPDRNPDRLEWATERLMLLNEAYDVLSNPDLRGHYDRARWPYIPFISPDRTGTPAEPDSPRRAHSTFEGTSRWNVPPAGPWWQQIRHDPAASAAPALEPEWLVISEWLKEHRLALLNPAWLALVGLWRSPYRQLLVVLVVALWLNLSILSFAALSPGRAARAWSDLRSWVSDSEPEAAPVTSLPSVTPTRLYVACDDPTIQITRPLKSDVVGDQLVVMGTVQPSGLEHYMLQMGYLGPVFSRTAQPEQWITLRPVHDPEVTDPPVFDAPLTDGPVAMIDQPAGYWVLRLAVTTRAGPPPDPCDVVFHHQ